MCVYVVKLKMNLKENFSTSDYKFIPPETTEVKNTSEDTLPKKSRDKYTSVYNRFVNWMKERKANSISEDVLLVYFVELAKKMKPSTLWSIYSMLRTIINFNDKLDISTYAKLHAFLKKVSIGFTSKKSKVLTSDQIIQFLNEAPDCKYLATKVALILGITGACRREELCNITVNDIEDKGSVLLITIPGSKPRSFAVTGEFYNIFQNYAALRPQNTTSERFFLSYQNGKCTHQVIGINKFGNMPKEIALYLNLPDAELYTGHSFRQTSASLPVYSGTEISKSKRLGRWSCKKVAKSDSKDLTINKRKTSEQIIHFEIKKTPTFVKRRKYNDREYLTESTVKNRQTLANKDDNFEATKNKSNKQKEEEDPIKLKGTPCSKLCRLCVCLKPMELLVSFRGTVYEKAMKELSPLGLLAPNHKGFPEEICQTCAQELLIVRRKIQKFCEADQKLLALVQSSPISESKCEEEFKPVKVKVENEIITIKEEIDIPESERDENIEMREIEEVLLQQEISESLFLDENEDER